MWVQIHATSREYGGPEEGGWWYDSLSIIFEKKCKKRAAKKLAKALELATPDQRYDRFSVLGGSDIDVYVGKHRFVPDTSRPRYE